MEREVAVNAVLALRRENAIRNGNMIDLTADMDNQPLQRCADHAI